MALPQGGPWPPSPHGIALQQMALWSAWWIGDPEGLSSVYGAVGGGATSDFFANRQGGVIPTLARFFWGRPSVTGQRKTRLHVPLAADIATASADLLFSEPPQFIVEGNANAEARADEIMNVGTLHSELLEAAEACSALGGGWLRLVWDQDVADHVMLDTVPADSAIGEWRWGHLSAVTFFTETRNDKTVTRHLERHEPGRILHGLYRGDDKTLGHPTALVDHPSTAPYADLVDEEGAIPTGVEGLTATYAANMRPQRRWRKIQSLSELGRSDFDGVEQLMDALDETYTSWMRDIRLAKARLVVPEFMLNDLGKGQGAAWDEDQEIYSALNMQPNASGDSITAHQFSIRVTEHRDTASQIVNDILRSAGYSQSTLDADSEGALTATEVVAREQTSARTRAKKTRYWSQALDPLLTTWLELDAVVFSTRAQGTVTVQWPDSSQPDQEALSRTVNALNQAGAVSTDTKVRMVHTDWDEEEIQAEVERVQAETGAAVPDLGPFA